MIKPYETHRESAWPSDVLLLAQGLASWEQIQQSTVWTAPTVLPIRDLGPARLFELSTEVREVVLIQSNCEVHVLREKFLVGEMDLIGNGPDDHLDKDKLWTSCN